MDKPEWLSEGAEHLLEEWKGGRKEPYDVVIVGSGYGAAVAAARLAGCRAGNWDLSICVLERGREHLPGTFPSTFSELPGEVRFSRGDDPEPKGVREGLFDLRIGEDVTVLLANGLGGGSLINAGVVLQPDDAVFRRGWPQIFRSEWSGAGSLKRFFDMARSELRASPAPTNVSKHVQFRELTRGLEPDRVHITVDKTCVKCGDCATGCNVGAKITLSNTYLSQAKSLGAKIYTGAAVSHLKPSNGGWTLFVGLTSQPRPLTDEPLREIRARQVILAAGALGSTEILMRSAKLHPDMRFSKCLGERFSTNGDMISAFYDGSGAVNAVADEWKPLNQRDVGPTITGMARTGPTRKGGIVIEELAIPGALRHVFEEVVTSGAMLDRLGKRDRDDHLPLSEQDVDPAAVDPAAIGRCQVVAAMGDDGAGGRLKMVEGWDDFQRTRRATDGAICVHWPKAGEHPVYKKQDQLLSNRAKHCGGTYLRNPLWQPLPEDISSNLSGEKPSGLLFTVHPLGGCPMGDDVDHGVVDHMGRVFDAGGSGVHPGLLVLDGSIVPTALGTNPLLTITALAERAIERYCVLQGWSKVHQAKPLEPPKPLEKENAVRAVTKLKFSERMTGELAFPQTPVSNPRAAELTLHFGEIDDIRAFLERPGRKLCLDGKLQLRALTADVRQPPPSADVTGSVELLVRGATRAIDRSYDALDAYAYARGRGDVIDKVRQWGLRGPRVERCIRTLAHLVRKVGRALHNRLGERWKPLLLWAMGALQLSRGYRNLASNTGEIRYLSYDFTLATALRDSEGELLPKGTRLTGRKTLQYRGGENPWRQLMDLDLSAHVDGNDVRLGTLSVDPAYLFNGFESRLQISQQRDLPSAWMDLASLGLFLARVILKIHFWSFRLPEYQPYSPERDARRTPGDIKGLRTERMEVPDSRTQAAGGLSLPITRYRKKAHCPHGPVVLFHGLGSGGIQFATTRVDANMAQYLAEKGFDVWVAELRTSIAVPYSHGQWTIDDVALGDIPRIVDFVLDQTRREQVKVVAHCIGSAMFCTAVLAGRLRHLSGESKIESAVLLQVGPLIAVSSGTRLRGLVAAPLRRFFPTGSVDFSVDDRANWQNAMVDRVLATYPYPSAEAKDHRPGWSWKYNSHIANCNRWAAIDGRMFEHPNVDKEMLDHLGEVLGHSSLTTWAQAIQYAFLERLTNSEGQNAYVTDDNVRERFRFPVRFLHGSNNDVFHPLTSWRSCELLKRVHGKAFPAEVRILKGYGHFDPLIGKCAGLDVFPLVREFLAEKHAWQPAVAEGASYFLRRPLIGPVTGWLRQQGDGTWLVRLWCRLDDLRSPVSFVVLQVSKQGVGDRRIVVEPQGQAQGRGTQAEPVADLIEGPMGTTLCVDVKLDGGPGRYDIVVLSAHRDSGEVPGDTHRKAEFDAGKSRSWQAPHLTIRSDGPLDAQVQQSRQIDAFVAWTADQRTVEDDYGGKMDRARISVPRHDHANAVAIAVACCRYPGWAFDRQRADHVFGDLKSVLDDPETAPSALLLVGDQIYADATAGAFDPKDRRERYYEAYREAWTAPNARRVLSQLPVYMMMDDHEVGDNWHPRDAIREEEKRMRIEGLKAFDEYQWTHSPRNGKGLYYHFRLRGFPVFVCDTRSGRQNKNILDKVQFDELLKWLDAAAHQADRSRPKFIVSPSVVVPFRRDAVPPEGHPSRSDGWDAYPRQLYELFSHICRERIDNVVFLCGDAHLSMRSEITFEDSKGARLPLKAHCIVASPMYAPYPFANATRREFVADTAIDLKDEGIPVGRMSYEVTEHKQEDGFTLVSVGRDKNGKWVVEAVVSPKAPLRGASQIERAVTEAAIAASAQERPAA